MSSVPACAASGPPQLDHTWLRPSPLPPGARAGSAKSAAGSGNCPTRSWWWSPWSAKLAPAMVAASSTCRATAAAGTAPAAAADASAARDTGDASPPHHPAAASAAEPAIVASAMYAVVYERFDLKFSSSRSVKKTRRPTEYRLSTEAHTQPTGTVPSAERPASTASCEPAANADCSTWPRNCRSAVDVHNAPARKVGAWVSSSRKRAKAAAVEVAAEAADNLSNQQEEREAVEQRERVRPTSVGDCPDAERGTRHDALRPDRPQRQQLHARDAREVEHRQLPQRHRADACGIEAPLRHRHPHEQADRCEQPKRDDGAAALEAAPHCGANDQHRQPHAAEPSLELVRRWTQAQDRHTRSDAI
eukprot:362987-Chlamydomonas_euryale.AAC.4